MCFIETFVDRNVRIHRNSMNILEIEFLYLFICFVYCESIFIVNIASHLLDDFFATAQYARASNNDVMESTSLSYSFDNGMAK